MAAFRSHIRNSLASVVLLASALLLGGASDPEPSFDHAAVFDWFEYEGDDPLPVPGVGEYANPVLTGFYPDPSITRVGHDFYLVTSTFSWFPGLPVFHSTDLVNWRQIGNAISRPDQLDFGRLGLSRGVFAPTIEHHQGTFYIANTCVDCGGNFVITATDPAGPWSDPVWLPQVGGIDPSLFFDDDSKAWILNNDAPKGPALYEGHRAIWIQRFDPATRTSFGPRTMLIDGGIDISTKPIWIEGPHIYKKDGWYYLSAAEGGTAEGHRQVVLRSRKVDGPYEPWDQNPYLTQRDLPPGRKDPITSAGHADLVQLPNGEWWATFLAVRPYEGDYYNTGRETFLMPVSWKEGWPRITSPGEVLPYVGKRPPLPSRGTPSNGRRMSEREEFNGPSLPPHWMMMRNPRERWFELAKGALWLQPRTTGLGDFGNPSFLARRQQHMHAVATTSVRFNPKLGERAGLAALQNDEYWYLMSVTRGPSGAEVRLERRAGPKDPAKGIVLASAPLKDFAGAPVGLRIRSGGAAYDFDYALDGTNWRPLATGLDGKILSTKTAGGFVGAVFGPYASRDR
ncbi:glycoside hydrolase family 43 protein [Sphingomonas arenae]|uniref:glycoside hydrolase family 43 protein n=1 Tax=Sphingomonas arenae TaxID=2812555 RepID=UPI0019670C61|nr:glycoside hydrolase family 43 protein [Sphingomonas arenae]